MIRIASLSALLLSATLLAGCATTQYHPLNSGVGYESSKISTNTFVVTFKDGGSMGKTQDLAMLRAAELAKENGYSDFSVIGTKDVSETHEEKQLIIHNDAIASFDDNGDAAVIISNTYEEIPVTSGTAGIQLTIQGYKRPPPSSAGNVYHASTVILDLKTKYKINDKGQKA